MTRLLLVTVVSALTLLGAISAQAATKPNKFLKPTDAHLLGHFDANRDGKLDPIEAERIRQLFAALKALDTNKDGELSDTEIAAAKIAPRKKKEK